MKANKFIVEGLNSSKITDYKQAIHSHDGINAVRIDMNAGTVTVDYDEGRYNEGDIKNFVTLAGLDVKQVK